MWSFTKRVLAATLGSLLALVLLVLILVGIAAGASMGSEEPTELSQDRYVLDIDLSAGLSERGNHDPLVGLLNEEEKDKLGLHEWRLLLNQAAKDPKIAAIALDCGSFEGGWAQAKEFRDLLLSFKNSKKPIYAHSFMFSEAGLYIASAATEVSVNPKGMVEFNGIAGQVVMYKGLLSKMGVDVQVFKVGTFKGAVEPFIADSLSQPNRLQIAQYLEGAYRFQLKEISESRSIPFDSLWAAAMAGDRPFPEQAKQLGLVDEVLYQVEIEQKWQKKLGAKSALPRVSAPDYWNSFDHYAYNRQKIAVLYAEGDIIMGKGSDNIAHETFLKEIQKLIEDDAVKAVVLRINSPGGSSFASDLMANELARLRKKKPLIVSVSNYSASGGYYMSCAGDSIFAQPNCITGSIGVFALIPNSQKLFNDYLGLKYETVELGEGSVLFRPDRPLSSVQQKLMQQSVDRIYADFTSWVAEGRSMPLDTVLSLAQGRVYTGTMAKELGLIDEFGGLDRALLAAQRMAKLKDYQLQEFPAEESLVDRLFAGEIESKMATRFAKNWGLSMEQIIDLKQIHRHLGVQSRLPWSMPN